MMMILGVSVGNPQPEFLRVDQLDTTIPGRIHPVAWEMAHPRKAAALSGAAHVHKKRRKTTSNLHNAGNMIGTRKTGWIGKADCTAYGASKQ